MLTGKFPFIKIKQRNHKIFNQKVNFILKIPLSNDSKHSIIKLLEKNVKKRLNDPFQIMNHSFLKGIDWDYVYNNKISPEQNSSNFSSDKSFEEQLN